MGGIFSRQKNNTSAPQQRGDVVWSGAVSRTPISAALTRATTTPHVAPIRYTAPAAAVRREEPRVVQSNTPVYTLSVTGHRVCLFAPSFDEFLTFQLSLANLKEGEVYLVSSISPDRLAGFTAPSDVQRRSYLERDGFTFGRAHYGVYILPALLLGCRVRDFEQRCATVTQLGDLKLTMPFLGRRPKILSLKTISGHCFEVYVEKLQTDEENRRCTVTCYDPEEPLPPDVRLGAQLEVEGSLKQLRRQPPITAALLQFHPTAAAAAASIGNWPLLEAIYGAAGSLVFPSMPAAKPEIREWNGSAVLLNPEQAEAVARYNSSCHAFAVEAPPGSGKTVTAAAMAVSYKGTGVQLFLSTANVPVVNMALALDKLDYGSLSPVHLISAEFEERQSAEARSPFSPLSLAMEDDRLGDLIEALEDEMCNARNQEERDEIKQEIRDLCLSILDKPHDIYFATVDTILNRLFKQNKGGYHQRDVVKSLLQAKVERVVVDEASQLTEAALNALVLCFPQAQIVLIGDSKQLPPFKFKSGDVVSQLASRPALEVLKAKNNLPVIKLRHVYRASQSLIAHYSDVFYEGFLVSGKQECKNPLRCFGARSGGNRCLFWKVKGKAKNPPGSTSKINFGELQALEFIIRILRNSNFDETDVMIISYYEAQRKRAEEKLPGFEVLTVDSAQGREKRIVIVLTTRTSIPADPDEDFFNSAKRCNVAVSRHQEALIVIGHPSIALAPNWSQVLSTKTFKHVENEDRRR